MGVHLYNCGITDGLPAEFWDRFDEVMDNRLAPSSRDKMMTGFRRWQDFSVEHGWSPFIASGDDRRGGRIAAWVLSMLDDTELTFAQYVNTCGEFVLGTCASIRTTLSLV